MTAQDNARKAAEEIVAYLWTHCEISLSDDTRRQITAKIAKHFPSPPSSAGEREAFEAWYQREMGRKCDSPDGYGWRAWQARAEISRALRSVTTTPDTGREG